MEYWIGETPGTLEYRIRATFIFFLAQLIKHCTLILLASVLKKKKKSYVISFIYEDLGILEEKFGELESKWKELAPTVFRSLKKKKIL